MATSTEISRLRRMTNVTEDDYSDVDLNTIIDEKGSDLNLAASQVWEEKAAKYAELVDTTESGSSRKNSVMFDKAMEMAEYFKAKADEIAVDLSSRSRTRRIVRV